MTIEIYKSKDGWRFRVKAANNKIIAASESYWNKQDAIDTATLLSNMKNAQIKVLESSPSEEIVFDEVQPTDDEESHG